MPSDDKPLFALRRDFSGGQNNRQHGANIGENQATQLKNIDITVPGEAKKRPGLTLVEDVGNNPGHGLFGFEPSGGTNELLVAHGSTLAGYQGSGSFTNRKTDFVSGTFTKMILAGEESENDVVLIKMDGNNWFRMNQSFVFQDLGTTSGTGTDSPPLSDIAAYFRQRVWILKDDRLYYSTPFPADYAVAFGTTANWYRTTVGAERGLVPMRDLGLVIFGEQGVQAINPSTTPAATDKVESLLDIGCVAKKSVAQVGDDIMFLARDGVRGLFRTVQDKVQLGESFPISFPIKEETDSLSWAYIDKASAIFFDNKYFISVPVDASTYNNEVWIYYPSSKAWVVVTGWNVADWATVRFSGQEKLYAVDSTDGKIYQAWKGFDDNGTAIDYDEMGRKEDFGQPLVRKSGGEIKIRAFSSGSYNLDVIVSVDDQDWVDLGDMNLAGNSPVLPVNVPFTLADSNIITETFHLDSLGPFYQLRLRIRHNATNGNDDIKIFERQIVTYADEYQSE